MQTQATTHRPDVDVTQATIRIQRAWRRKLAAKSPPRLESMDANSRWKDAAIHARMKVDRQGADEGKNDPRTRWRRAGFLASRIQDKNTLYAGNAKLKDSRRKDDKMLETQHWLELVDSQHRYGANRINYLVNIDDDGKLRWARNNVLIDTTEGKWQDLGEGKGIIPQDGTHPCPPPIPPRRHSFGSWSSTSFGPRQQNETTHYGGPKKGGTRFGRAIRRHFTLKGRMDKLLRKTVGINTWIYVADENFNIFIGIKGIDMASKLLYAVDAGGIVTSAGLISIKDGIIHKLSPLSGHYRTSVSHFRKFVGGLSERGVDMRKAKISKAEVILRCMEYASKIKGTRRKVIANSKGLAKKPLQGWGDDGEETRTGTFPTWKRDILEG
ncbi:hypothetical protein EDB19DRAFT_1901168 [Suillus lakei]|nr:hypothetical protein EDB19DRAFT_1901168 [Suillus lakei]